MAVPASLARARFPAPVLDVLRTLASAGHRSWLVGGAVRDLLLERQRTATDFDVATPARPEEVMRLFRRVIPTGVAHGTVTVLSGGEPVEVTTFRGEGAYRDGRHPESVTFLEDLEADLARRDFTMNALAFDPLVSEFRDPFGGREDMRQRRIRAVGDAAARFGEDGLRPMRAVRFAAQLGYALEPATREAIPGALDVVRRVAVERITEELSRLLVAPHAGEAFPLLGATGLLGVVLPPLAAAPEEDRDHAFAVAAAAPPALAVRLAALLHVLGPEGAQSALAGLRLSRDLEQEVVALARGHVCPRVPEGASLPAEPAGIRRWIARVEVGRVEPLLALAAAEAGALPPARRHHAASEAKEVGARIQAVLRERPPLSVRDLALDGLAVAEALGTGPGPQVGEALRYLLDRVLERPEENEPGRLRAALREWSAQPRGRI